MHSNTTDERTLADYRAKSNLPRALSTDRLTIRQWRVSDVQQFDALYQSSFDGHLEPWMPEPRRDATERERLRDLSDRVHVMHDKWDQGSDYRFLICRNADETVVGQIGITGILRSVNQSGFIGYWIGREYLNAGYATEATLLAMHYAFELLRLHRISLWISPENPASLRVAEKLGLRHEGCIREALYLGGRWQDTEIYTILDHEWKSRKDELIRTYCPNNE